MAGVIVLTGLPGVGKTTIASQTVEMLREEKLDLRHVNYGTVMLELAKEEGMVEHRDQMRDLPVGTQTQLQKSASETISERSEAGAGVIVDTHMMIPTPEGYWPGLSTHNLDALSPRLFLLIEAKVGEIIERRRKDERARDIDQEEEVESQLLYSRYVASSCSVMTGAPVKFVQNNDGKLKEAVDEVCTVVRQAVSSRW